LAATASVRDPSRMRIGNKERRGKGIEACVVCGITDARLLSTTTLMAGERVTVCGSHKAAHRRSDKIATSIDELRKLTGERRSA
jgi:hypothetical protein